MKISNNTYIYIFLVALIPFLVDSHIFPSKSSYFPVLIITLLAHRKFGVINNEGFVQAMFLLAFTGLLRFTQFSIPLLKDVGLMLIGILPFLFNSSFKVEARTLNRWIIYGFLFAVGTSVFSFHVSVSDFINSTFGVERGASTYTFGLFAIYWTQKKNYKWMAINCFFMLLGGKRIAMASILICLLFAMLLKEKEGEAKLIWKILLFYIVYLYLRITFNFAHHAYDSMILDYTDKSADAFTLGRQQLYSAVIKMIPAKNYWGIGPGNTVEPLNAIVGLPRMHNDFLKIFAENGMFLFCGYFYLLLRKIRYRQIPTLLFIFALFTATNTLIYVYMLFMYCVFMDPDKYLYDINDSGKHKARIREKQLDQQLKRIKKNERFYGR